MSENDAYAGPYILWTYYGSDGWSPRSFSTLEEAVGCRMEEGYNSPYVITKLVNFEIKEV